MTYEELKNEGLEDYEIKEILLKQEICDIGKRMYELGFVAATDGNISVRIGEDEFLTTPSGVCKAEMTPYNIPSREVILKILTDNGYNSEDYYIRPSSEFKMHLRCYRERPDINAVIHAHPPTATGFAAAGIPLDDYALSEAVMIFGSVPIAPYAVPGSEDVPESIAPYIRNHDAVLLANHGVITVGADLKQAFHKLESLELYAKTILTARLLGGPKQIPDEKLKETCDLSKGYALKHPGFKKYSV